MINSKDIQFYHKYGYLKVRVFSLVELDHISKSFQSFLTNRRNKNFDKFREDLKDYKNISKIRFKKFMKLNDRIVDLYNISTNKKVMDLVCKLNIKKPILSSNPQFRTDFPKDKKYSQPLHQDILYNLKSKNALTIWTCLHDCSKNDGAIEIFEKTHKKKIFKYDKKENPRRFEIIGFKNSNYKKVIAETKIGQSVIFNQNLVHKSGINQSQKVRISFQVRFSNLNN